MIQQKNLDNFVMAVKSLVTVVVIVGSEGHGQFVTEGRMFDLAYARRVPAIKPTFLEIP